MNCSNCGLLVEKKSRFCPNCGNKLQLDNNNIIDKNIDTVVKSIRDINEKLTEEISQSRHLNNFANQTKTKFTQVSEELCNACFLLTFLILIYGFIYEPNLYRNPYLYTMPSEYYPAIFGHFGYLFIYLMELLGFPLLFTILKFSKSHKIKNLVIPVLFLFTLLTALYYLNFIEDLEWKTYLQ